MMTMKSGRSAGETVSAVHAALLAARMFGTKTAFLCPSADAAENIDRLVSEAGGDAELVYVTTLAWILTDPCKGE